ncbi:MAG: hypothetical protein FWF53_02690 [Candidatus Azobacteroides sp.]|nr:hypothetical protein [Candidatus Azobacteroides sp.]
MKKYLLIATVFALGLSFAACGGGQKTESATTTTQDAAKQATMALTDSTLAKLETLINQGIDLQGKIAGGDTASVQALTQLTQDIASCANNLQSDTTLAVDQKQKLSDLTQKWSAAVDAATNAANAAKAAAAKVPVKAPVKK